MTSVVLMNNSDSSILYGQLIQDLAGPIAAAVVYRD
jgi:hypothetical protein